jgi:hypothetical protein
MEHISDDELQRIAEFAATPSYARSPEQLLPNDAVENDQPATRIPSRGDS